MLAQEVQDITGFQAQIGQGGVSFKGPFSQVFNIVLQSRLASRVFMSLFDFKFEHEKQIANKTFAFPWQDWIRSDQTLKINTILAMNCHHDFKNSIYLSQLLKDGIVDKLRKACGQRPSISLDHPDYTFLMRIERMSGSPLFRGEVYLDLCGNSLSNRGYRQSLHPAPLRENLAAALVMSSGWDGKTPFWDPMCGSGTILIEAISYQLGLSPSLVKIKQFLWERKNPWSFLNHNWFTSDQNFFEAFKNRCQDLLAEDEETLKTSDQFEIWGSDWDLRSVKESRLNIKAAGLGGRASVFQADVLKIEPDHKKWCLLFNPPYGERLEDTESVLQLYYQLGEHFKQNFSGSTFHFITSQIQGRKQIGLQTQKRQTFYNGPLECRLFSYELR